MAICFGYRVKGVFPLLLPLVSLVPTYFIHMALNGIGSFDRTLTKPFIQFIFFKIFFFRFCSLSVVIIKQLSMYVGRYFSNK